MPRGAHQRFEAALAILDDLRTREVFLDRFDRRIAQTIYIDPPEPTHFHGFGRQLEALAPA